jgi:hypothetical protein
MAFSPEIWGPRLWRLLHLMADLSDRTDIYPLWNSFLRLTAVTLPCQKCQKHMGEYWTRHTFMPKGWNRLTAPQVRQDIRAKLHAFHNTVNDHLGKPDVPLPSLPPAEKRGQMVADAQSLFEGLKAEWGAAPLEWKRTGALLLSLVRTGT